MRMPWDVILVGGGLANSLIAYRLQQLRPEVRFLILEQGDRLGGNHVWSFNGTDLNAAELGWIAPLIYKSWASYEVRMPAYTRNLDIAYHSITSAKLHAVLGGCLGDRVRLHCPVQSMDGEHVRLADGSTLEAHCVVDGRGLAGKAGLRAGYQKFVGLDVSLESAHELTKPLLMDVALTQPDDGYEFFYLLPWSDTEILIEDTYYSDSPTLDTVEITQRILEYAVLRGWKVKRIDRTESGVLLIPLDGRWQDLRAESPAMEQEIPCSGVRGGLFHAVTGYSLPHAVRFADRFCRLDAFTTEAALRFAQELCDMHWRNGAFMRTLNRLLFMAARPKERYRIFEAFYRHPQAMISRFYAGALTPMDRIRLFSTKPPVPVHRAVMSVLSKSA
jgi:lycopene beta-cyclase